MMGGSILSGTCGTALPIARTTPTVTPQTSSKPFPKSLNGENESPQTMPPYTITMKPTNLTEYKEKAKQWACDRLADSDTVILDLESTGLLREDPDTEIAQICIIDIYGRPLFSMLLKPSQPMGDRVIDIHKIRNEQVVNQPIFPQIAKIISFILKDKHVIAWNMEFDWVLLTHMFK